LDLINLRGGKKRHWFGEEIWEEWRLEFDTFIVVGWGRGQCKLSTKQETGRSMRTKVNGGRSGAQEKETSGRERPYSV
jgi:hypothetical protein